MNYINLIDKALISDSDLSWQDLGAGIHRKIMAHNNQMMLVKVAFEKGAIGILHQHPHLQVSYVAEGSFEVTVGENKKNSYQGRCFLRWAPQCCTWRDLLRRGFTDRCF